MSCSLASMAVAKYFLASSSLLAIACFAASPWSMVEPTLDGGLDMIVVRECTLKNSNLLATGGICAGRPCLLSRLNSLPLRRIDASTTSSHDHGSRCSSMEE